MLSTSFEYRLLAQNGARPLIKATLILANGTRIELVGDDFIDNNPTFSHGTSSANSFDIGSAIVGSFKCTLNNYDRRFETYDFTGAKIIPFIGIELSSGNIEWLRKGTYHIEQPSAYSATIELDCSDSMSLFDVIPYSDVTTKYPAQAATIVNDIAVKCGVPLVFMNFMNHDVVFNQRPDEDMTCRDALSYIAQATGNYARITNEDKLEITWYDQSVFATEDWLDGGEFDEDKPYSSGDDADGGNFDDYSSGYVADGGSFDSGKIVNIIAYSAESVMTDDVVITGIRVTAQDEVTESGSNGKGGETAFVGTEGYVLEIEGNPFITYGRAREFASNIAKQIQGMIFRPFDASVLGDPRVEAGDAAIIIDRHQNTYRGYLTNVTYKVGAYASYMCAAEPPARNLSSGSGAITKALKGLSTSIKREQTSREQAIDRLNEDLANSSGMYTTPVVESTGTTWLMHDKPTVEQSQFVWKINAAGLGISVDGGKNYQYGIDKWGTAILNSIYAVGINADYITTGSIRVRQNDKTIFCADVKAGQFWWNATYSQLTNTGELTVKRGNIGGFQITANSISTGRSTHTSTTPGLLIDHTALSTSNGFQWNAIGEGAFYGGYGSSEETGYISFNTYFESTGVKGTRIGGKGMIALYTPIFGIGQWANRLARQEIITGTTVTKQVVLNSIAAQGSVTVKPTYGYLNNVATTTGQSYPQVVYLRGIEVVVNFPRYNAQNFVFTKGLMTSR